MRATTTPADVSPAGRQDIAHHLHPYTQLRQLERESLCADMQGFSRHAAVRCEADDREGL